MDVYPLSWPEGWPRTEHRIRGRYRVTFEKARRDLYAELARWGATDVVLSTDMPMRRDGHPYASRRDPDDPGAALYWRRLGSMSGRQHGDRGGEALCLAIDCWDTLRENVRALGLAVSGMRLLERTGAGEVIHRAFEGFRQLPEHAGDGAPPWVVLGVSEHATVDEVRAAFRALALVHHPDRGGSTEGFQRIVEAQRQMLGG